MTTFTVWKFEDTEGAERAEGILKNAAGEGLVTIVDHALLVWPEGADEPELTHKHDSRKHGAAWGTFWGVLGGALFTIPIVGAALGAGIGILLKATEGTGISEEDLTKIRTEITPGTSALFLVTENADVDGLGEHLHMREGKLLSTNLTAAERSTLLDTFGSE